MSPRTLLNVITLSAVLVGVWPIASLAKERSVEVSFKFDGERLTSLFPDAASEELKIARRIQAQLQGVQRWHCWKYEAVPAQEPIKTARLEYALRLPQAAETPTLKLALRTPHAEPKYWTIPLNNLAGVVGLPAAATWADHIPAAVHEEFGLEQDKKHPVLAALWWSVPLVEIREGMPLVNEEIVLPLHWDTFKHLKSCGFDVRCRVADQDVTVKAIGTAKPGRFGIGAAAYRALTLRCLNWLDPGNPNPQQIDCTSPVWKAKLAATKYVRVRLARWDPPEDGGDDEEPELTSR